MEQIRLNTYVNLTSPQIKDSIDLKEWVEKIKNPNKAQSVRPLKSLNKTEYDNRKVRTLPAVSPNFLFEGRKTNSNIIGSTGLIYIDIDEPSFDILSLNLTHIIAYFKSLSGVGYGIYVRVDGLALENIKDAYQKVGELIGVADYIDKLAGKATQYNVLTYDKDAYYNGDCIVLDLKKVYQKPYTIINKIKKKNIIDIPFVNSDKTKFINGKGFNLDNQHEYYHLIPDGQDSIYNEKGFPKIKVNLYTYKYGNRNNTISIAARNLIWCNRDSNEDELKAWLWSRMRIDGRRPLSNKEFNHLWKRAFKEKIDRVLKPRFEEAPWFTISRSSVDGRAESGKHRKRITRDNLYKVIEEWNWSDGKIVQVKVAELAEMKPVTVKGYWKLFKFYVKDLNNQYIYKNGKSTYSRHLGYVGARKSIEQAFDSLIKDPRII